MLVVARMPRRRLLTHTSTAFGTVATTERRRHGSGAHLLLLRAPSH